MSVRFMVSAAALSLLAQSAAAPAQPAPTQPAPAQPASSGGVVLVVSSAGRDSGRTRPGFEMDELTQAYLIFTANGFTVTIASPAGGAVQADKHDASKPYNAEFMADTIAMRKLANTARTASLRARDFAAIFVVGGKGAMFDLPLDTALARLAGEIFDRGGVVSAVCHGPAGLIRARTKAGTPLLAGRAVTGFSNEEEQVFGKKWVSQFPFLLESEIRSLGATWQEAALMMPHVAIDGRLVTGQNPYSTAATAEAVVRASGRSIVARTPWADERAVNFASAALRRDLHTPRRELAGMHKELRIDMIGLLGYYQLQTATDTGAVRAALTLMELAAPYMPQPQITLGMADAYARLGRLDDARVLAKDVVRLHPEMREARDLLTTFERGRPPQ